MQDEFGTGLKVLALAWRETLSTSAKQQCYDIPGTTDLTEVSQHLIHTALPAIASSSITTIEGAIPRHAQLAGTEVVPQGSKQHPFKLLQATRACYWLRVRDGTHSTGEW